MNLSNNSSHNKGQIKGAKNALENVGIGGIGVFLLVKSSKPTILKSEGLDNSFDKSGATVKTKFGHRICNKRWVM